MTCALVIISLSLVVAAGMWAFVRLSKTTAIQPPAPPVHPCTNWHFFEPIATRPIDGSPYACKHTSLLSRCRVCLIHKTEVFPGEFTLVDFTMPGAKELERAVNG
jgi:hypothetical protein